MINKNIFVILLLTSSIYSESVFERLSKRAEERYQRSSDKDGGKPKSKVADNNSQEKTAEVKNEKPKVAEASKVKSEPILGKHKKFSPAWWDKLLKECKGCQDSNEIIDCDKLLKDNPQWQEIKEMDKSVKDLVMVRMLSKITKDKKLSACRIACAICAGGDPDSRNDEELKLEDWSGHHTAIHLVVDELKHYALFELLLRSKANPNLNCNGFYPLDFARHAVDSRFQELAKKYGANVRDCS